MNRIKEVEMKRQYEKPAVVFEKDLEALANVCAGTQTSPSTYNGDGTPAYCKGLATCTTTIDS